LAIDNFGDAFSLKISNLKKLKGARFIVYNAEHISHIYGDAEQERPYVALTFVLKLERFNALPLL